MASGNRRGFPGGDSQDVPWLFFRLSSADAIPACLEKLPPKKFPKFDQLKTPPDQNSELEKEFAKKKPPVKVLIIDGDGAQGRKEGGDSFFIQHAIELPKSPYTVGSATSLRKARPSRRQAATILPGLAPILFLNVRELNAKQLANLEAYSKAGGGVVFFMGPNVNAAYYNKNLFKGGKGVFPVPLEATSFPPPSEKELAEEGKDDFDVLLRDDLFPEPSRYPIFGQVFDDPRQLALLKQLPIRRYFKVPRADWRPEPGRSFELATLPNRQPATALQEKVLALVRGDLLKKIQKDDAFKKYQPISNASRKKIEDLVRPGEKTAPFIWSRPSTP